jgi:hypothetical protein
VPGPRAFRHNIPIDAFSIIANPQAKFPIIVPDFSFNVAGLRVPESVSQHLAPDPVDLVLKDGRQTPMWSFHRHTERWRSFISILRLCEFLAGDGQQMFQIGLRIDSRPKILNRIPALNNGLLGGTDSVIEGSDRLFGAPGKMVASPLHLDQGSLKALKHGVVEIPSDARPLRGALIKKQIQAPRDFMYPQSVKKERTKPERDNSCQPKQPRVPPWRINVNV